MILQELLCDVKNYLDITFEDEDTDKKTEAAIKAGMTKLNKVAGKELKYEEDSTERQLLRDYCRYVRANAAEEFDRNFQSDLIMLRIGVQTDDYAAGL